MRRRSGNPMVQTVAITEAITTLAEAVEQFGLARSGALNVMLESTALDFGRTS
jgi:hypothetical protein